MPGDGSGVPDFWTNLSHRNWKFPGFLTEEE